MEENKNIPDYAKASSDKDPEQPVTLKPLNDLNDSNDKMETHAHHLHHAPGKKFRHYLYEFLMLFLAVFCGFFAENLRERNVENHRAKQFIVSIAEDLKTDIHNLDSTIRRRETRANMIDSLFLLLNNTGSDQHGSDMYYYARWLTYYYQFINNDRTIQQLKYSGNFRLIQNQELSSRIMDYDQQVRWIEPTNHREEVFIENYVQILGDFFDSRVFDEMLDKKYGFLRPEGNPGLLTQDKNKLYKLINAVHFFKAINIFIKNWQTNQKMRAQSILDYIKSEYHLN